MNDPSGTGSQSASGGRYVLLIAESIVSMVYQLHKFQYS
jgi:hypothetical protein